MVTEAERDDALATLLIEQVEGPRTGQAHTPPGRNPDVSRWDRFRVGVTTGAVLIAVVAVTVLVLTMQRPEAPVPAGPTAPPTPGQVLATFNSADGHDQTRTITPDGAALEIVYRCTGEGTIAVTIPGGLSFTGETCEGPVTTSSPTGVPGSVPVAVTSSGSATWTVTVRVLSRRTSQTATPAAAGPCHAKSLTLAATRLGGALGTDYGFIDITNHSDAPCALRGQPTAFLTNRRGGTRLGAPVGHTGQTEASKISAVTLQPNGGRASLRVAIANIGGYSTGNGSYEKACGSAIPANGWDITLPGSTTHFYVPIIAAPHLICSSTSTKVAFISEVVPLTRTQ